jgi:hypothetical protein
MSTSETFSKFAEIARGYCSWCEHEPFNERSAIDASKWLAYLHAAALDVQVAPPENSRGLPELPPQELAQAIQNLAGFNGMYYRECFDPDPAISEEPVIGDVGDDLLDIYKDVKAGLLLHDRGEIPEALWHWSFLHNIHWGLHAVGALRALHCLATSKRE